MDNVVIASTEADARAAEAVEQHHAQMAGALATRVEALVGAASAGDAARAAEARADLVGWCDRELVPHALAEEKAMYPAAQAKVEGRLLVEGMLAEHQVITGLVQVLGATEEPVRAAA
ncbi:MAG: hemerythrin domain-containing protein, partial [Actinomycetota bacterium]